MAQRKDRLREPGWTHKNASSVHGLNRGQTTARKRSITQTFQAAYADEWFNGETFEELAARFKPGDEKDKKRYVLTDPATTGLQVIIRASGAISYHTHYTVGDRRPLLLLGHHPKMTIARARELTRIVIELGAMGIDPQEGLHERLIRELEKKGTEWRP
jgi:hypothetical protein